MGYAFYEINGKPCGYGVEATCEEPGCDAKIDRGLGYLCGRAPGGDEHGCGGYFCGKHLVGGNQCARCRDRLSCAVCGEDDGELKKLDDMLVCAACLEEHGP